MKRITQFLCRCANASDRTTLVSIGLCVAYLLLMAAALLLLDLGTGCATTPAGLNREQALYQAGTNVVATIREVVPYLPAPAGTAVEGVLALATAALAAWNTHQHLAIKRLKNGNGNGATVPDPAPGPTLNTRT